MDISVSIVCLECEDEMWVKRLLLVSNQTLYKSFTLIKRWLIGLNNFQAYLHIHVGDRGQSLNYCQGALQQVLWRGLSDSVFLSVDSQS